MNICSYTYLFEKWRLCIHILQENLDNHAISCSLKYCQVSPPFILSCIFSHFKSYTFHFIIKNLLRSIYFKEWKLQKLKGSIWLLVNVYLLWFWLLLLGFFFFLMFVYLFSLLFFPPLKTVLPCVSPPGLGWWLFVSICDHLHPPKGDEG